MGLKITAMLHQNLLRRQILMKFPAGSLVMAKNELRKAKSEEKFTGPFKVKERTVNGT